MTEREDKPIRVVDRRMFTADGEPRPDFQPEEAPEPPRPKPARDASPPTPPPSAPAPGPGGNQTAPPAEAADSTEPAQPRTTFGSFVGWVATNAYAALGLLPDAAGRAHRDIAIARQMIDWLAVLEQKTRGNLSFEETDFLSRALYELRLAFVEVSRRPPK